MLDTLSVWTTRVLVGLLCFCVYALVAALVELWLGREARRQGLGWASLLMALMWPITLSIIVPRYYMWRWRHNADGTPRV